MDITETANRTLVYRDSYWTAQDALGAISAALISVTGKPSEDAIREFELAAADLVNTLRSV